ncbi:MAG: ABC transporter ATP-binding protein [Oscillospiraceae bacterium]|nr:ABC transporter ATP-binding protein [Oscillospiraceae bacterium]
MGLLQKIKRRLRDGTLREIWRETAWIWHHTRAYHKAVLFYILLGFGATALSILASLGSKELINSIVYLHQRAGYGGMRVAYVGVPVVLLAVCNILLSALIQRFSARINLKVTNELRAEVFGMFLNTDWESLQQYHSGDLLNRINSDVTNVAGSVLGWLPNLIVKSVQFVVSLVVILCYDPTMALLALVAAPISLILARPMMGKLRTRSREMFDVRSEMMAFHEESLQNAQSVKAFNLVDAFRSRLNKFQDKFYDVALEYNRLSVFNSSLLSGAGLVISYLCLGWGAYRLWRGRIDFGTMVLFLQLAGYLSSSLTAMIRTIPAAIECSVSAQRIISILDLPREDQSGLEAVRDLRDSGAPLTVHIEDLQFSYQSREHILKGLELNVLPREMIAIVGPSGSGKTTLFRILLGLLRPTGGTAEIVSGETRLPLSPATRSLFAYVPQDNIIFSGTIADMLRLVRPEATDEELYAALRVACAEDFVRNLPKGLYSPLRERGDSLSVGQNQRLAIARAVLTDAPILLLDEVTSALDSETEERVLKNLAGLQNKTCILSTHRPSVLSLCSAVYRLQHKHLETVENKK